MLWIHRCFGTVVGVTIIFALLADFIFPPLLMMAVYGKRQKELL